jgi:AraC-like DNA-binding protein
MDREELAIDDLVLELVHGLMAAERGGDEQGFSQRVDMPGIERVRQYLHAEKTRVVRSAELESISGLTRYETCRQFKIVFATSPHRYLLMRRLEFARESVRGPRPLSEIAFDVGVADQAHFTRAFKAAFGLTPGRYRSLTARPAPRPQIRPGRLR